jgi:hypothetical protein
MTADIFEVSDRPTSIGVPYIKAVFTATAGPMKSTPVILEPLQDNDSKVIHLTNIPVPIPSVNSVDVSLIFDVVNYRWTPSAEMPRENGVITFDMRMRAAFSLLGKSYTLQLDQRPCTLTLTKPMLDSYQEIGQRERSSSLSSTYGRTDERTTPTSVTNGSVDSITGQLDIEEQLRQLGSKLLVRH